MVEHYIDQILEKVDVEHMKSWSFANGFLQKAIFELYRATNKDKYFDFSTQYYQTIIHEDGLLPADVGLNEACMAGLALFDVYEYTELEQYSQVLNQIALRIATAFQQETSIFLVEPIPLLKQAYPILLFYAKYGHLKQDPSILEAVKTELLAIHKRFYNKQVKLYSLTSNREAPVFWLGGMAYLAMLFVDICEFYPDPVLVQLFTELIEGLDAMKRNYLWFQIVNEFGEKFNYPEVSGSLMVCYAYLKGAKLNLLSQKYYIIGVDIFHIIRSKYFIEEKEEWHLKEIAPCSQSNLDFSQKETFYQLPKQDNDIEGVAPLILVYAQLKKVQKII